MPTTPTGQPRPDTGAPAGPATRRPTTLPRPGGKPADDDPDE